MQKQDTVGKKVFANSVSDRDLDLEYIKTSQNRSLKNPIRKWATEMSNFTEKDILIANKKRCSTSPVIKTSPHTYYKS